MRDHSNRIMLFPVRTPDRVREILYTHTPHTRTERATRRNAIYRATCEPIWWAAQQRVWICMFALAAHFFFSSVILLGKYICRKNPLYGFRSMCVNILKTSMLRPCDVWWCGRTRDGYVDWLFYNLKEKNKKIMCFLMNLLTQNTERSRSMNIINCFSSNNLCRQTKKRKRCPHFARLNINFNQYIPILLYSKWIDRIEWIQFS